MSEGPSIGMVAKVINLDQYPALNGTIGYILFIQPDGKIELGAIERHSGQVGYSYLIPTENLVRVTRKIVWEEVPW